MKDLALFAKALSDPNRLRIIAMLRKGELCVCEIADALRMPQSSLSTHLQCLRMAGVVKMAKKGTWAYYAIDEWAGPILDDLETHFKSSIDPTFQQDELRLQARLDLRKGGCCVVGYGQLIQLGERNK